MDETLPGRLIHIFLISILDAALLSWIALRLYRRSVRRLMRAPPRLAPPIAQSRWMRGRRAAPRRTRSP